MMAGRTPRLSECLVDFGAGARFLNARAREFLAQALDSEADLLVSEALAAKGAGSVRLTAYA